MWATALPVSATVLLAQTPGTPTGPEFGKASPLGLAIVLILLAAVLRAGGVRSSGCVRLMSVNVTARPFRARALSTAGTGMPADHHQASPGNAERGPRRDAP